MGDDWGLTVAIVATFGASLALGFAKTRSARQTEDVANVGRRVVVGVGLAMGGVAILGFVRHFGLEVGLAWFLLWAGLAAPISTLMLSFRERPRV